MKKIALKFNGVVEETIDKKYGKLSKENKSDYQG